MFPTTKRTLARRSPPGCRKDKRKKPTNRTFVSIVPAAVAALLVVTGVSGSTPGSVPDGSVPNDMRANAATAPSVAMALEELLAQLCYQCIDCGSHGHRIMNRSGGSLAFHPHPCQDRAGACDFDPDRGGHPRCGATEALFADAGDVIQTLKESTPDELAALVASIPDRLLVNRSRNALQLIGCSNQVVASYSVNSIPALGALVS